MKAVLFAALALLVTTAVAAPVATAHHGGWDCYTPDPAEVCLARTINSADDCILRVFGMRWCW